ncbi:uncharacterized protein LOC127105186 [Lathyrus oleraceus]|uniref:uncharacterized protein LOC127105186 n=1 Tax=Pisum sativum TaxID=3888 RepID=UPI0021CF273F|nr:uncharacterized protein LOC127105186 [Pisum sativum]
MRHVSLTGASLPPSSRWRQVSLIQTPEVPELPVVPEASVPPPTNDASESVSAPAVVPVPPSDGENVEPKPFEEGYVELSLLPLYPDHSVRHILDKEDRDPLKFINQRRKITGLPQLNEEWFYAALSVSGMRDLCMSGQLRDA